MSDPYVHQRAVADGGREQEGQRETIRPESPIYGDRSPSVAKATLHSATVSGEAPEARDASAVSRGRKGGVVRQVRRLVLFPFGQHELPEQRNICVDFVLRCRGDLERFIDAPNDTIARFASHVSRIRGLRDGSEQALVVMTVTNPLAMTVVGSRKQLESLVPCLRRALWMIYVDPKEDPFFLSTAERLGTLSGPLDTAPIWVGPGLAQFIVVSPRVTNFDRVAERIGEIERGCPEPSRLG